MLTKHWQIVGALVTLVTLIAGCTTNPTATPPPTHTPAPAGLSQIVLLADHSLGGLSSDTKTTTIDTLAGTFLIERTSADPVKGVLSEDDFEALAALIAEVSFFDLEANYIPDDGTCCDLIAYTVTVTQNGQTYSVRASDSNMPDGFRRLLGRILTLTES